MCIRDRYKINLQGGKKAYQKSDRAGEPLFDSVDQEVWDRPTYHLFTKLLDNYVAECGVAEVVTDAETDENWDFVSAIMDSECMQYVHQYLVRLGKAKKSPRSFASQLYNIWFQLYRRENRAGDSSGFEHVFVGEEKDGKIIGFHNWIQFYFEEKKNEVDYKGFIVPRKRGSEFPDGDEQLLTIQFAWDSEDDGQAEVKMMSSMLIGVSPEFEMALYTLCFLAGEEENVVKIGPYDVMVKCYKIRTRSGIRIGSSFPVAIE
eukprot:TRINITY_DN6719_c0_g1_i2.p1 TRINITY_DN6719_c0_g1~~TRINITY_DN6719_c0_g1_i2.p1  ORF type:complete len:261 (-),score=75.70 TRINITY_DN6719_c0_g1_i2:280-1062(-)